MNKPLFLHFPISKIDEEERVVYGIATSEAIDSQGDIIDYEASKKAFAAWKGNIREMHQPVAVGKTIDIQFDDDTKSVTIGAKISESADGQNAWLKVKEGVLTGFSIGGAVTETKIEVVKDGDSERSVRRIVDYGLSETSLVDNPANPEALFSMVKSVDGALERVESMHENLHRVPAWYSQFMPTIEKAQALYDGSRNKDENVKTKVTKAEREALRKSVSDAGWLAGIAQSLVYYIQGEAADGENVDDLKSALNTITAAVAQEIQEGDDFEASTELLDYVYYAQQVIDLSKKKGSDVKKADEAAEEVVETPAEEEEKVEAEATEEEAPAEGAEEEAGEEPAADAEDETQPAEGEEKSVTIGDLKKFTDQLFSKLGDHNEAELKKALGEFTDKVEKSMTDLAGRVSKLESQPAPSKAKATFSDVEKGKEAGTGADGEFTPEQVAEMVKRRDELAKDPTKGDMEERIALMQQLRKANRAGLLKN